MSISLLGVRELGLVDYPVAWQAMQRFTNERQPDTVDEIWLLQHPRVFTQGQAGKAEHLLLPGDIPVIQADRGGQVTYHGPGQLVCYLMLDVRRLGFGVRELVSRIEQSLIDLLASYDVQALAKPDAPGVYVQGAKIASLGLRIRNGRSFHGLALNVDMDLEPFGRINPCGYAGMAMTQLADLVEGPIAFAEVGARLRDELVKHLGYAQQQTLTNAVIS
ncbi:lipoyl(octanoyl) transferase LipB [Pseudomonas sp. Choline-3u-10]|jgi:lipoyl(octanoyl) transferase|uniref:lipoyl(octanoyl) transferase LipB n=1 Tax=Pseudomonadaceae TaxID=135621 RepID=UPI000617D87D|nr:MULTISPECIES: lipoyl(octanoyl) transferase LipB [Pseudomonadaceae]MAL37786.1 lipoyl(octanoyl) transferase LipB [Pseudomonas sp.]MBU0949194.1 lipoyl(octanoyl) transferase LipB [Gammaproteobacteria bacterium]KJJ64799.1 lipoate--protein ligase [Pseudomonas sp. 10B238]MBK3793674.1 lipoyl(octanoyl) transferase LipB [Stutzerimonas stutzeri]MBK3875164.1 lipoyl(octanoyl) transferase LipB [Stutzerimonas stutzeri]|tara:strand:+ start:594 stop:1250 length:657 start_codon:yes stop_codon:yes gene_type:complete